MFVERSNGKYNNRTFPTDSPDVWRGNGLHAIQTDEGGVYEFRVWDPKRPMDVGREVVLYRGSEKRTGTVESYGYSFSEDERYQSTNCGVMVLGFTTSEIVQPMNRAPRVRQQRRSFMNTTQ